MAGDARHPKHAGHRMARRNGVVGVKNAKRASIVVEALTARVTARNQTYALVVDRETGLLLRLPKPGPPRHALTEEGRHCAELSRPFAKRVDRSESDTENRFITKSNINGSNNRRLASRKGPFGDRRWRGHCTPSSQCLEKVVDILYQWYRDYRENRGKFGLT